jgi:hypothetical protein
MRRGGFNEGACHVAQPISLVTAACPLDVKTCGPRGLGQTRSHPVPVGLIGHLVAHGRPVIWAVGRVPVGQPLGPVMGQRPTASQPVAGRPPLGRIDTGVGEPAATAPDGPRVRVERVMCGLPPMARLHVQGLAEAEREAFIRTQVGPPGPGDQACDRDDEPRSSGRRDAPTGRRGRLHLTGHEPRAALVEEADVQGPGRPVDAAVTGVLGVVQSPGALLLIRDQGFPTLSRPRWSAGEGASISIKALQRTEHKAAPPLSLRR